VFAAPHPDFGEAVAAVVELTPGAGFDGATTIEAAKTSLAAYKVPKRILVVNEIPCNYMSKVRKAELRAHYRDLFLPLPH
jgi:malonyl-CoA/methylmalonyl-CoA synthetase